MIYTHHSLDLDAAASVWFYCRFVKNSPIQFMPANWNGTGSKAEDVILDLDCGIKGFKDHDGRTYSCFATLVKQFANQDTQRVLNDLSQYLDMVDSTGCVEHFLNLSDDKLKIVQVGSLKTLFQSWKRKYADDDQSLLDKVKAELDCLYEELASRDRACYEADRANWVGKVAIIDHPNEWATMNVLFDRGAAIVIKLAKNNRELAVVRADHILLRLDHPAIRTFTAYEPDWFFHPAGFMCCRGNSKSGLPDNPTGLNIPKLAALINTLL